MRWAHSGAVLACVLVASGAARADSPGRPVLFEYGGGPTAFTLVRPGSADLHELGGAFQLGARVPIGAHFGFGARLGWGLTTWRRTEEVAGGGVHLARDVTEFLGNAWSNVLSSDRVDEKVGGSAAMVVVTLFCLVPYAIAGVVIALSPLAATSYAETAFTFDYEPLREPRYGPFLRGGAGVMIYLHPGSDHAYVGVGPTAGIGFRFEHISLALVGTYIPNALHSRDEHTPKANAVTTSLVLSLVR